MTRTSLRLSVVPFALLALAGCSFDGSASDPDAAGTSSASSSVSTSAGASTVAPPVSSTSAQPAAGGGSSAGGAGSTEGAPAAGNGPDRCHTSELTGSLAPGDPGAGQRHATLVLTDTGGETCTVYGYGGVGLVDAGGKALPTDQVRVAAPAPALVTLRPGDSVSSQLQWGAVPGDGDAQSGDCQPTASTLQVIPPDETDPLSVAWQGGPVCQGGRIQQQAYVAG
jgi:hypothetical protein